MFTCERVVGRWVWRIRWVVHLHHAYTSFTNAAPATLKNGFTIPVLGVSTLGVRYIPEGSIVIPGISDSHCHILEYGASRQIPMAEAKTIKGVSYITFKHYCFDVLRLLILFHALETVSSVAEYITAHPDLQRNMSRVVQGWGWDHASWDVKKCPTWVRLFIK